MANQNNSEKYAYLDQLSTERLEALIRADIDSPDNTNDEVIFHILEVMKKREQEHHTGRLVNVDEAWAEFQRYYNVPDGDGLSLYPVAGEEIDSAEGVHKTVSSKSLRCPAPFRLRHVLKTACITAAIVIGIFATLMTVQAAGIDVFGAIGRWTEDTFHFVIPPIGNTQNRIDGAAMDAQDSATYQALQSALNDCGITADLAPTWYPDNFEVSDPKILRTNLSDTINIAFYGKEEQFFSISIMHFQSASDLASHTFEKDSAVVEQYTSGVKTFYILSNIDTITATYSEGLLVEQISGSLSIKEIKAIIDSIGV